jgi:hypothetical protein
MPVQPGTPLVLTCVPATFPDRAESLPLSWSPLREPRTFSLPWGSAQGASQAIRRKARSDALLQLGWARLGTVRAGCDLPNSSQPPAEEEPVPHPGFTRPDLRSIGTAAEQAELADAACGGLSADGHPLAGGYRPAPPASGIDRAIRRSTAAAVLALAGIAAYVSYWHAYVVVRAHGETGITARLEPATIDGLVYASSMVVLYAARHKVPVPALARWLLGLGIAATLTANMAQGWSHGPVGAVVTAWPAVSLIGSYELLVWLVRTAGAADRGPSAGHLCAGAPCRAAVCPVPASAVDGERPGVSERGTSDPAWRPAGQAAGPPRVPASGQRAGEAPGGSGGNDAAAAAYRLSVQAGNPLSERRLAQMFGRTSRRWARARIADARQAPPLPDSPSTPVTA